MRRTELESAGSDGPPVAGRPLAGLRVLVCRPVEQAGSLVAALEAAGAEAVSAPVIAVADPDDGGAALRTALRSLAADDWLVLTSPNGAARVAAAVRLPLPMGVRVAVIGSGTARRAVEAGLPVDLLPKRSTGEGLLEALLSPEAAAAPGSALPRTGRALLARAAGARRVLPEGLRRAGWDVLDVVAYRTVGVRLTGEQRREAAAADAVVFTSSSAVDGLAAQIGVRSVPPIVASIGPATTATAERHGLEVAVQAAEHTIPGVVDALRRFSAENRGERAPPRRTSSEHPAPGDAMGDERGARAPRLRRRAPLPRAPIPTGDPRVELLRILGERLGKRAVQSFDAAARAFRAERFEEARPLLRRLAGDAPAVADVRELNGLVLYRLGRFKAAVRELEAFRRLSGSVEQHPVLADCHRALGRWADVDFLWQELGARSPSAELVAEGRIVTAGARADRGDLAGAVHMLEKGWRLPPRPQQHHLCRGYALADLYERTGRSPRARELFAWVEKHDPHLADVTQRVRAIS